MILVGLFKFFTSSEHWMNFFSVFISLMTCMGYIFYFMSLFLPQLMMRQGKNQFFKYFWRILPRVKEKTLNTVCYQQLEYWKNRTPYKLWRNFRNYATLTAPFIAKFTFGNSNFPCLEHFLFYSNNCFVPLQILSYWELNVVAGISWLAIHRILFSFSWLAILILNLKATNSRDFQHETISGIFVHLSKEPPYFCPLEVI